MRISTFGSGSRLLQSLMSVAGSSQFQKPVYVLSEIALVKLVLHESLAICFCEPSLLHEDDNSVLDKIALLNNGYVDKKHRGCMR